MPSDSISDAVDEIVEHNTPAMSNKLFEFPCAEYSFIVIPIDSSSFESPEYVAIIQQMVSSASFFVVVWILCLSPIYLHLWG